MYSNQTPPKNENSLISNLTTEQQTSTTSNEAKQQSKKADGKSEMSYPITSIAANQEKLKTQVQHGNDLVDVGHLPNDTVTSSNSLQCTTLNIELIAETNETDFSTESNRKLDNNDETDLDVISSLIGPFGRWQLLMTILLSLFQVPNTFHISSSVYQVIRAFTTI